MRWGLKVWVGLGASWGVDSPAEDHSGWRALNSTRMFCSLSPTPASTRWKQGDDTRETWREGEYGASEESITVYFWLLCSNVSDFLPLCLIFGSRAGPCTLTCNIFPFSVMHWNASTFHLSLSWQSYHIACRFYHLISSCLQLLWNWFYQIQSYTHFLC